MSLNTFNAETAENLEDIEKQFAVKAVAHAQTYMTILSKRKGSELSLTPKDDEIYDHAVTAFPEFLTDPNFATHIDEDKMKSQEGKKRWREFMNTYEKTVEDFNFGTLLRADPSEDYTEENTIFVPRMQFLAFEIFRNRHELNDWIYNNAHKN